MSRDQPDVPVQAAKAESPRPSPNNVDMARFHAQFAEALAEYGHLPVLFATRISIRGSIHAFPSNFARGGQREVCEWAKAFGVPVELDLTQSAAYIRTSVTLRDIDVRISSDLGFDDATRFGKALSVVVKPGERTKLDAAALLDVLGVTA